MNLYNWGNLTYSPFFNMDLLSWWIFQLFYTAWRVRFIRGWNSKIRICRWYIVFLFLPVMRSGGSSNGSLIFVIGLKESPVQETLAVFEL